MNANRESDMEGKYCGWCKDAKGGFTACAKYGEKIEPVEVSHVFWKDGKKLRMKLPTALRCETCCREEPCGLPI